MPGKRTLPVSGPREDKKRKVQSRWDLEEKAVLVIKQNRKSLYRLLPCNDHNCDLKRSRDVGGKGILFTKPACLFDVAVTGAVETLS